jgi:hypothetical protein
MEIKSFKMISGEEIIGKVNAVINDVWVLESVRLIITQAAGPNKLGVGFMPYIVSNMEGKNNIYRHAVACEPQSIAKDLEMMYLENVSGLQLPPSGSAKSIIMS